MTAVELEAWQKKWKRKSELERKKDRAAKKAAYTKETNKKMREVRPFLFLSPLPFSPTSRLSLPPSSSCYRSTIIRCSLSGPFMPRSCSRNETLWN